eukprot:Pgem_evm1s3104
MSNLFDEHKLTSLNAKKFTNTNFLPFSTSTTNIETDSIEFNNNLRSNSNTDFRPTLDTNYSNTDFRTNLDTMPALNIPSLFNEHKLTSLNAKQFTNTNSLPFSSSPSTGEKRAIDSIIRLCNLNNTISSYTNNPEPFYEEKTFLHLHKQH